MRKFAQLKLCQAVLAFVLLWQILATHQFCGEFIAPEKFFTSAVASSGQCKGFTLIGIDSVTGQYGALSDKQTWYLHLLMGNNNTNNGLPIYSDEQQQKLMDESTTKFPSAGRHCVPITFSVRSLRSNQNHLQKAVSVFSVQLLCTLLSLVIIAMHVTDQPMRSVGYERLDYVLCTACGVYWFLSAMAASELLINWTHFWECINFRADVTHLPMISLVLSTVLVCSSFAELYFSSALVAKRSRRANLVVQPQYVATGQLVNVIAPPTTNGSAADGHANAAAQQNNGKNAPRT